MKEVTIYLAIAIFGLINTWYWAWRYYGLKKKCSSLSDKYIQEYKPNENYLRRQVWDCFLVADMQYEQWRDEDTCDLIVDKIMNDEPIMYSPSFKDGWLVSNADGNKAQEK